MSERTRVVGSSLCVGVAVVVNAMSWLRLFSEMCRAVEIRPESKLTESGTLGLARNIDANHKLAFSLFELFVFLKLRGMRNRPNRLPLRPAKLQLGNWRNRMPRP